MKVRKAYPGTNIQINLNKGDDPSISYSDSLVIPNATTIKSKSFSVPLK